MPHSNLNWNILAYEYKKNKKDASLEKKDVTIEVVKTAIDGKNAVVTYKNENGKEEKIELVKVKGKWLVNMKKEMPALSPGNKGEIKPIKTN